MEGRGRQRKGPRNYTADERAKVLGMTYAGRQLLGLRRTGAMMLIRRAGKEREEIATTPSVELREPSVELREPQRRKGPPSLASIEVFQVPEG